MWDYFSKDLKYNYISLLLKDLSPLEQEYLQMLQDSVDGTVNSSVDWVDENFDDLSNIDADTELWDYIRSNGLEEIVISLLNKYFNRNHRFIRNFYNSGSLLGYNHMGVKPSFYSTDKLALNNLMSYTDGVIRGINRDVAFTVYDRIGKSISKGGELDGLKYDLINIPSNRCSYSFRGSDGVWVDGDSYFSPYVRCLFASRTEYARAVNTGLLQSYSNYGVTEFDWVTSGLPNVCKYCLEIEEGNPYTLREILEYGCPYHVNCSCSVKGRWNGSCELSGKSLVVDLTPK